MRALIRSERPHDGILGEEHGLEAGSSRRRWVLDPIDGTRLHHRTPHLGTLIALEDEGRRVLGIIDQPVLRERFIAYCDRGSFIRRQVRCAAHARLRDACSCPGVDYASLGYSRAWNARASKNSAPVRA